LFVVLTSKSKTMNSPDVVIAAPGLAGVAGAAADALPSESIADDSDDFASLTTASAVFASAAVAVSADLDGVCVTLGCVGAAAAVCFNGAGAAPKAFFDLVFAAAAADDDDDDDDDDDGAVLPLATVAGSPTAAFPPAPTTATFPAAPTSAAGRDVDGARAATTDAAEVVFALAAADVGAFAVAAPLAVAPARFGNTDVIVAAA
jgi:hypothetical protein